MSVFITTIRRQWVLENELTLWLVIAALLVALAFVVRDSLRMAFIERMFKQSESAATVMLTRVFNRIADGRVKSFRRAIDQEMRDNG
jgi:hypothetical protein